MLVTIQHVDSSLDCVVNDTDLTFEKFRENLPFCGLGAQSKTEVVCTYKYIHVYMGLLGQVYKSLLKIGGFRYTELTLHIFNFCGQGAQSSFNNIMYGHAYTKLS